VLTMTLALLQQPDVYLGHFKPFYDDDGGGGGVGDVTEYIVYRVRVLEAMALDSRRLEENSSCPWPWPQRSSS